MQTILGAGNIASLDELVAFIKRKKWLENPNFQWRLEGSHDYANLDPEKDEISEGQMVQKVIELWEGYKELQGKLKFESFKYLGHITRSFGWLGDYKTYWGPKFNFCEPQKGFHCVLATDGKIYHCPRTIDNLDFYLGDAAKEFNSRQKDLKQKIILDKEDCLDCSLNMLCGGGCVVQKKYYQDFDCQQYALSIISEFIDLMKDKVLERASDDKIISINKLW